MATKKTTSKSKTNTTKAVKVTKKTVSTKSVKVIKNSKQVKAKSVDLSKVNIVSAAVFLILAIVAGLLMAPATYEITVNYLTPDAVAQSIVPAYRHFLDIDLRWVLVAMLVLSALVPVLHLTARKQAYQNYLKGKIMPWRWVEQGILQAFMVSIVAFLLGYQDLATLKLFALTAVVISFIGWVVERETLINKAIAVKVHIIGIIVSALTVLFLAFSLLATPAYGQIRASWYVYAAFATFAITLGLNSLNQFSQLRLKNPKKNYEEVERNYLVIGLVSKVALAIILIAGISK